MKVLITGASGFIGRQLVTNFERNQIEYVCLGRSNDSNNYTIGLDLLNDKDLFNTIKKINATHLVHLAWYTVHKDFWNSHLNIDWLAATYRLIDAFLKNGGSHVLVTGTCAEYDWRFGVCLEGVTPTEPRSLYGIAKNSTRSLVTSLCDSCEVPLAWARIFFPYGKGEASSRLIPSLFRVFGNVEPEFAVNTSLYRDLLHVSDVAEAIALCSMMQVNSSINISSGQPTSLESLVRIIASACDCSPGKVLDLVPNNTNEPIILIGENSKLRSLGWKQRISLEDGLSRYESFG